MRQADRLNMTDVLHEENYVAPGPNSQNWQGVEAMIWTLDVPPQEYFESTAPKYWPQHTVLLHAVGLPVYLLMEDERVWRKTVSRPGDLIFAPSGDARRFSWTAGSTNMSMSLDPRLIEAVVTETVAADPDHISLRPVGHFIDPLLSQIGYAIMGLLKDSPVDSRLYGESLGVALLHHLLYHHAKRKPVAVQPRELPRPGLTRALDYLHAHFEESLSLEDLAAQAGMSVAHFSRLFRQATGLSPYQYLIRVRCEKACELMSSGRYTVTEVAHAVGFFDHSHFIRHFKRLYRVTPGQWLTRQ